MNELEDTKAQQELRAKVFLEEKDLKITGEYISFKGAKQKIIEFRSLESFTDYQLKEAGLAIAVMVLALFIPWRVVAGGVGLVAFTYLLLFARKTVVAAEINQRTTEVYSSRLVRKAKRVKKILKEVISEQDKVFKGQLNRYL
jgi:hypothetical protein